MKPKIGFAILSHNEPRQLLKLVTTLSSMFGCPPIVCHHDFSKCDLNEAVFPKNVRFVHPHIVTGWGVIAVPLAALKAFHLLRKYGQPEWFVQLSGSDYPVQKAVDIIDDMSNANFDAYLDNREVLYRAAPSCQTAHDGGYERPSWMPLAYDRYCAYRFWLPRPSIKLLSSGSFPIKKKYFILRNPQMNRWLQHNRPSRIYAGDFWFQANRKAIDRLLDEPSLPRLVRYFRGRPNSEEAIFHTVLCNQSELRICKNHKRYADWTRSGEHPEWLDVSDVVRGRPNHTS